MFVGRLSPMDFGSAEQTTDTLTSNELPYETKQSESSLPPRDETQLVNPDKEFISLSYDKKELPKHVCTPACDIRATIAGLLAPFLARDPSGIVWGFCIPADFLYEACVVDDVGWARCVCSRVPALNPELAREIITHCCEHDSVKILEWSVRKEHDYGTWFGHKFIKEDIIAACESGSREVLQCINDRTTLWNHMLPKERQRVLWLAIRFNRPFILQTFNQYGIDRIFMAEMRVAHRMSVGVPIEVVRMGGHMFEAACWRGDQDIVEYLCRESYITMTEYSIGLQCAAMGNQCETFRMLLELPARQSFNMADCDFNSDSRSGLLSYQLELTQQYLRQAQDTGERCSKLLKCQEELAIQLLETAIRHADGKILAALVAHGAASVLLYNAKTETSVMPQAIIDIRDLIKAFSSLISGLKPGAPADQQLPAGIAHLERMLTPFRTPKVLSDTLRKLHTPGTKFTTSPHDGMLARAFKALAKFGPRPDFGHRERGCG